ncbi:MAG: hypothetical protein LUD74_04005, partial [Tannerellaceae bacterium]|nr:hypothetical protein [Tannerellaceae bacterium]
LYDYNLPNSAGLMAAQERKALDNAGDSILLRYTEKNPDSKLAFWRLIRLMSWSYEPVFDSIYNAFSDNLKNGYAGQVLKDKLQGSRQLAVGNPFPEFNCQNTNGEIYRLIFFLKTNLHWSISGTATVVPAGGSLVR